MSQLSGCVDAAGGYFWGGQFLNDYALQGYLP